MTQGGAGVVFCEFDVNAVDGAEPPFDTILGQEPMIPPVDLIVRRGGQKVFRGGDAAEILGKTLKHHCLRGWQSCGDHIQGALKFLVKGTVFRGTLGGSKVSHLTPGERELGGETGGKKGFRAPLTGLFGAETGSLSRLVIISSEAFGVFTNKFARAARNGKKRWSTNREGSRRKTTENTTEETTEETMEETPEETIEETIETIEK